MKKNYSLKKRFSKVNLRVHKSHFVNLALILILSAGAYAQQTYTFTTCGATGRLGPSQSQATLAYQSTNLSNSVIVSGGIQSFTIPQTGPYRITALGAQGGSVSATYAGGKGASMQGEFFLTAGTVLKILVGQRGEDVIYNTGGGGGSFVWVNAAPSAPLIVAGGGGGAGFSASGVNAGTTTAGSAGTGGTGTAGTNGSGANPGGGGWLTDGINFQGASCAAKCSGNTAGLTVGGASPSTAIVYQGCAGTSQTGDGGFGGASGGNGNCTSSYGAGGGGGYSGGVGQSGSSAGGGAGGSFNAGTNQNNQAGVNSAAGRVTVEQLCNITMSVTGTNSSGATCAGNSVTLTTNAISNYSWSNGATTSSIVVSPSSTTVYSLTATSPNNCTASSLITVTVSGSLPTLTVANTAPSGGICPTRTVMLTATGALTYTWTGGSITVTNGIAFAPPSTATYVVTGANGCGTSTVAASVSVHPLPNVTGSASSLSLCAGSSLTLTGVGNATAYAWSGASGIANGVGFVPGITTNYTVVGTSALSCTAAATVSVQVFTSPNIPPTVNPAQMCIGGTATLTATGATGYTWTGGPSTGNNGTYVVTPSTPGTITYTIVRANSTCTTSQQISVITNSLPPVFAIVNPAVVCAFGAASLAVAGAQTYTWTSPGNPPIVPSFTFTGANPVVFPPVNTIYTVTGHDGTCAATTTVSVGTNPNPTLTATSSFSAICAGAAVTISVTGANNYTWTSSASTSNTLNTSSITDSPTVATAYNVTGSNSFGCTGSAAQIVLVNASPIMTVSVISNKTLTCNGGNVTFNASGADTYSWSTGQTVSSPAVTPTNTSSGPVVYTVSGTNTVTQCSSSKTISVNVFIPVLTISGTTITCPGGPITLTATGGSNNYVWQTPSNTSGFQILNTTLSGPAVFTVSANTNSANISCPSSKTIDVNVYTLPVITAAAQRTTICVKESVVLTAGGGTAYVWSNNLAQTTTISVSPNGNTTYSVTGTDVNGCTNTGTVSVKVLGCTGIMELGANSGLNIYPNPNSGEFFIQSSSDAKLTLVNELGQIVRTFILSGSNNYKVQVSDMAQGVYFLNGEKDGQSVNMKIVVTK